MSTRSSARLRIEKHPSGAGDSSGFHSGPPGWRRRLHVDQAGGPRQIAEVPSHVRGAGSFVPHGTRTMALMAGSSTSRLKVDQSVSISDAAAAGRTTHELVDGLWGSQPTATCARITRTSNEPSSSSSASASPTENRARHGRRGRALPGESGHRARRVYAHDLARSPRSSASVEGGFAGPTPHIEQPLTLDEVQVRLAPTTRSSIVARPPRRYVHRGEEHLHVRVVIDSLVAETVCRPPRP